MIYKILIAAFLVVPSFIFNTAPVYAEANVSQIENFTDALQQTSGDIGSKITIAKERKNMLLELAKTDPKLFLVLTSNKNVGENYDSLVRGR